MLTLAISTTTRETMIDITDQLRALVRQQGWTDIATGDAAGGALMVFCPHTTCGLTINEGADPDVKRDLMRFFCEIAPHEHGWKHAEGNTDAHIRASLIGASVLIPMENGMLKLGTWQSVYLYEGDGPRQRMLWVQRLCGQ